MAERLMKNTNVGWIREIPQHWESIRGKYIFINTKTIVGAKVDDYERLALTLNGVIKRSKDDNEGLQPTEFSGYQILKENELVFKLIDLQNISTSRVGLSKNIGIVSPAYVVLKTSKKVYPSFAEKYYLMMWMYEVFNALGDAGVRSNLNAKELLELRFPLPPYEEQIKIADFLDSKCLEIDNLSKDIEHQIELLEEYKKSIITEVVTKGLNSAVEMKDSSINWIGIIPNNWRINKGKYIFKLLEKPVKESDDVITCFRDGEVTLRSNRREDGFTISLQEIGYQGIDVGDLIVHGMDGFAGSIGISDSRGKASPVLNNLGTDMNKRYYMYYLRNLAYQGVFVALSTGIRVRTCDTNWGKLRELLYLVPPTEVQNDIAEYIDMKLEIFNSIILDKKKQLDKLAEYKKSLIYEYVTGKKEVA